MSSYRRVYISTVFAGMFFFGVFSAEAHVPNIVDPVDQNTVTPIHDPELSQAFYGTMSGFPHTFEIRASEPFVLFAQILMPDIEGSMDNISGIIIKERPEGGRVEEIARLSLKGPWPREYEPFGGDSYRMGPSFEKQVGPGVYRIEVNTPDNVEKYVLVVGKREAMGVGYFELIGRLMEVKSFFGKSKLRVVESPYVYVPLIVLLILGYGAFRRRSRWYTAEEK